MRPDSGFMDSSKLKLIDENDQQYFWENDETVLGGVWFFETHCGNRFYCRANGTIAKWHIGNYEISNVFGNLLDFADSFVKFYSVPRKSNDESPFNS